MEPVHLPPDSGKTTIPIWDSIPRREPRPVSVSSRTIAAAMVLDALWDMVHRHRNNRKAPMMHPMSLDYYRSYRG